MLSATSCESVRVVNSQCPDWVRDHGVFPYNADDSISPKGQRWLLGHGLKYAEFCEAEL